jgi:hypothetical protein
MWVGYSSVHSQPQPILQPNSAANPSNAHVTNMFGSMVGGVTGCGGAGGSAAALAGNPGYTNVKQNGGESHRRGGYKKRHQSNKRCKCRGKCHCKSKRRHQSKKHRQSKKRHQSKRRYAMRGGMASLSPASFSGVNPPYQQYMSNLPNSPVYALGGELAPAQSGMASPPPIDGPVNRCS